jgi:hypothetical protein
MAAKWTFMVYMAGNNSLSDVAGSDLDEMRQVGSSPDVQVLAFIKQANTRQAQRIRVGKDGLDEVAEQLGDVDSGDPQTVIDFIRWGVESAPAEKYAVILWNHGGGWTPDDLDQLYSQARLDSGVTRNELNRRANQHVARLFFTTTIEKILAQPTEGQRQICNDDGSGHSLDTLELGRVIELAASAIGHRIDLLGMDACLMSTLEVAYQVRSNVDVIVGSEDLEPGAGWCYDQILNRLSANPDLTARELGTTVVEQYVEFFRTRPSEWPVTQVAMDTQHVNAFSSSVDALTGSLSPRLASDWPVVLKAQSRSVRFEMELLDLMTFCGNLSANETDKQVRNAADAVRDALQPGEFVIAEGHIGPEVEGCGGISLYFPAPTDSISQYYADLDFARAHGWDEFLRDYHAAIQSG